MLVLPDSPVTAKFLSNDEKLMAVRRLKANQTGVENKHLKVCCSTILSLSTSSKSFDTALSHPSRPHTNI